MLYRLIHTIVSASEFKVGLLYYGIPCLLGILPEPYLTHFALLVKAAHILLGDNISLEELDMAEKMLDQFYKGFSVLYGKVFPVYLIQVQIYVINHEGQKAKLYAN